MAYLPHCRVTLKGVLGNSALGYSEIFTTGYQVSDDNFASIPTQAQVDAMAAGWTSIWGNGSMNLGGNAFLTGFRVAAIDAAGHVVKDGGGAYVQKDSVFTPVAGGGTAPWKDLPVSSVATFVTTRAGAHGRGRMYLPVPNETPDTNGYCSNTSATNRATQVRAALVATNTALATGAYVGHVVVASSAGFLSRVTFVRCGNVHDTQRRRRNALTEVYQAVAI